MRTHHRSASPFEEAISFSRAVRHGNRIEVAGTAPIDPDGTATEGDAYAQATRCFAIIREAIEALGGSMQDVIRTRMYVVHKDDWELVGRAHGEAFRGVNPAATMVLAQLLDDRWRCEIEATAIVAD